MTLPEGSTFTVALSQPPAGVAGDGPMTLWFVPADTPGLAVSGGFDGLGLRGNASSPVRADGATIPAANRLGDDGAGLDLARIRERAASHGLLPSPEAATDVEAAALIFQPGFSTASEVTELAGRGVGMDVVSSEASALGGRVEVESATGRGTRFAIRLPLTLAIIDGFLVGVGASSFVVPLDMVVECVELSPEETRAAQGRDHLNLRGEVLPFIRLKALFENSDLADDFETFYRKVKRTVAWDDADLLRFMAGTDIAAKGGAVIVKKGDRITEDGAAELKKQKADKKPSMFY